MFSVRTLTGDEARVVAETFLRAGRDPAKMADLLGWEDFDDVLLSHPLVRREVLAISRSNVQRYSMVDHMSKLEEIRDMAMADSKWTAALSAEKQLGQAAGLYDHKPDDPEEGSLAAELSNMSTTEIRRALAKVAQENGSLPPPEEKPETIEMEDTPLPPDEGEGEEDF